MPFVIRKRLQTFYDRHEEQVVYISKKLVCISVWLFSVANVFITFHVGVNQSTGKLKIAQSCFQSIRNFDRQFA